jgi:hypothetical protein
LPSSWDFSLYFSFCYILHESIVPQRVANPSGSSFFMVFHKVRSSSILLYTSSFLILFVHKIFSILLQHQVSKASSISGLLFRWSMLLIHSVLRSIRMFLRIVSSWMLS